MGGGGVAILSFFLVDPLVNFGYGIGWGVGGVFIFVIYNFLKFGFLFFLCVKGLVVGCIFCFLGVFNFLFFVSVYFFVFLRIFFFGFLLFTGDFIFIF
jgi:hypothetical protein